jgi:hypothetical protein
VDNALAEADQQAVFLQTDEAIFTLRNALEQVPGNIVLNQKLVEICEQSQRWPAAIAACEALAEAFTMAGDGENATRYSELQSRYQAMSEGGTPAPFGESGFDAPPEFEIPTMSFDALADSSGVAEFAVPEVLPMGIAEMQVPDAPPSQVPESITLPPEFTTPEFTTDDAAHEVDLSGEWESMLTVDEPAAAPAGPSDADRLSEEITGHLSTGMIGEASLALEMMRALAPDDHRLADLESRVQQAVAAATPVEAAPEDGAVTDFGEFQMPVETPAETSVSPLEWPTESAPVVEPVIEAVAPPPPAPAPPPAPPVHEEEFSLDLEHPAGAAAGDDFELELDMPAAAPPPVAPPPVVAPPPPVAAAPPPPVVAPPPEPALSAGMADLLGAIEDSLGDFAPSTPSSARALDSSTPVAKPTAPAPEPRKSPPAPAASGATGGGLADVFADFKQEMEQDAAVDSDVENHYNMGIAFKEMGLYDEAIGEFQKAFHGAENSPSHPNFIPVCSLLAHCFLEKNLPELAVKWLQNGLKAPGLDREGEMALRYEIGSAQEAAGQKAAAMESFMLVYALNIDYRDVADRIRSLKGN